MERTPRVLHIITRLDAGGAATNTVTSVDGLRSHGFGVALAYGRTQSPSPALMDRVQDLDVPLYHVPGMGRSVSTVRDCVALLRLLRILRQDRFDLVHTHCSKAGAIGRLAARLRRVPAVHTPHGHIFHGYFGALPTVLFVSIERRLARHTARIVSLTDRETEESLEQMIGTRDQYVTVPSGVPLARFREPPQEAGARFREEHGVPPEAVLVLAAGRLVPIKGFDILLRSMPAVLEAAPQSHLVLCGDGPERQSLAVLANSLGVAQSTSFTGHLEDMRPAFAAADVFAMPSRNEGMGRALVEAMAAGTACIGTRTGGIPEVLRDGVNGILVPCEEADALSEAILRLARSPERRDTLGREAADSVYPAFDESTMVERLSEVYRGVLS